MQHKGSKAEVSFTNHITPDNLAVIRTLLDGVRIAAHDGGMWVLRNLYPDLKQADKFGRVKISNNCRIGMNALIMPRITIGDNCAIGAETIVTHGIPFGSIAVGIPTMSTIAQGSFFSLGIFRLRLFCSCWLCWL